MAGEPLVEELALDIAPALDAIVPLGVALDDIVTGFGTSLADALSSAVGQPIDTSTLIDTSGITDSIDTAVTDATSTPADVSVDADTTALDAALADALDGPRPPIDIEADTSDAETAIAGLDTAPVTISVDADTSEAQDSIDALGDAATGAAGGSGGSSGIAGLEGAVLGVKAATGAAQGEVGGLTEGVGALGGASTAVALGGGAAFVGFLGETISKAADAQAQTKLFTNTFGDFSDKVRQIDIGGLNISLEDLGKQSGTTNADLEASATRIGLLGNAAGAAKPQIASTASDLLGIAGALAVSNPRLGDAATVADTLSRALSTGRTRSLIPYGISLTQNAIVTEALRENVGKTAAELTGYDKVVAGVTLVSAQFGDTLGTKFASGSQNAQIQLRALKTELEETLVAVGTPLLGPAVTSLEDFLPVAQAVGVALGNLGQAVLPIVADIAPALGPVATVIGAVAQGITVLDDAVHALSPDQLIGIGIGFGAIALSGGAASAAVFEFGLALDTALGPVGLVLGAVGLLGAAFGHFHDTSTTAQVDSEGLAKALQDSNVAVQALNDNAITLGSSLGDKLQSTLQGVGKTGQTAADGAAFLGLSYADLTKTLLGSDDAFNKLDLSLLGNQQGSTDDQIAQTNLSEALDTTREALIANASSSLQSAVASGVLTQKQIDAKAASLQLSESGGGLIAIYTALLPTINANTAAQAAAAVQGAATTGVFAQLRTELAAGSISTVDATTKLTDLGISADDAKTFVTGVTKAVQSFIDTAIKALPDAGSEVDTFQKGVNDAFGKVATDVHDHTGNVKADLASLKTALDPASFVKGLFADAATIKTFTGSLEKLSEEGFSALVAVLAEKGPTAGGPLAAGLASDANKAKLATAGLALGQSATGSLTTFLQGAAPGLVAPSTALGDTLGSSINAGYTATADLGAITARQVQAAAATIDENAAAVRLRASDLGQGSAAAYAEKLAQYPLATDTQLKAAQSVIDNAKGSLGLSSGATAADVASKYHDALDLPGKTSSQITASQSVWDGQETVDTAASARRGGIEVGFQFDKGIEQGMANGQAEVDAKAIAVAQSAVAAARGVKGFNSSSPSKVGIQIGTDFVAGIAIGVSNVAPVISVSEDAATAIAATFQQAGTAALGGLVQGFNDPTTVDAAIAQLNQLIANATAASATPAETAAQSALAQFLSTATSQLPTSQQAISTFSSTAAADLGVVTTATTTLSDAQKKLAADSAKGVDVKKIAADETSVTNIKIVSAAATDNLNAAEDKLARDRATHASKATISADELKVIQTRDVVRSVTESLNTAEAKLAADRKTRTNASTIAADQAAVNTDKKTLASAQAALSTASDPTTFTKNITASTAVTTRFLSDLKKFVAEGNIDLAQQLAASGPEVAGKLADSFAGSSAKAKLAEAAIDSATTLADTYQNTLNTLFAPIATSTATTLGTNIGTAISTGATTALSPFGPGALAGPQTRPFTLAAAPAVAVSQSTAALQTLHLDLTINNPDGTQTKAKSTVQIPFAPSNIAQKVIAAVSAQ